MQDQIQANCSVVTNAAALIHLGKLRQLWQILAAVLRGYCAGQPLDDARPRKGCC